jgi:hypothetical protein
VSTSIASPTFPNDLNEDISAGAHSRVTKGDQP